MAEDSNAAIAAGDQGRQPQDDAPKTFSQEDVDRIVKERVARAKAKLPDDYDEVKAKAAELDRIKDESKSELEKAADRAAKAEAKLAEYERKAQTAALVAEVAASKGVDAELLARMSGDTRDEVEANADFIAERLAGASIYPLVADNGAQGFGGAQTPDDIEKIKDPAERLRARARYNARHRRK